MTLPAFCEASKSPLPLSIWRNKLRVSSDEFAKWLPPGADMPCPLSWADPVCRVQSAESVPFIAAYLGGLIHIQEQKSMLPVILLDPEPLDRILDL